MSFFDGLIALARGTNKIGDTTSETQQGVIGAPKGELTLDKPDMELIELADEWEKKWKESEGYKELERKQKENEKYWLGDHYTSAQKQTGKRELIDNLVFEALETALPFYTKQKGEPIVTTSDEGKAFAKKVMDKMVEIADTLRLRLKVKKAVRHWALYYLGCVKIGWSMEKNEIAVQTIRPQQLILDPDSITDECEYDGEYIGHYRTDTARNLLLRFQEKEKFIGNKIKKENLGTKLRYVEWWTPEYIFWTMEKEVLGKSKNPHWNYDQVEPSQQLTDIYGNITQSEPQTIPGRNHFSTQRMPFVFLSVFNVGKTPFDTTNLIEQVLPLQDVVNKRQKQIDRNADRMNAGGVFSGNSFTKEEAKQANDAINKGFGVWVPTGDVNTAYKRESGTPIPQFIYQSLVDYRNEIRSIFGTTGLSSQGIKSEETVRGKILTRATDVDRNPITDHLEQFYDAIYNWFVQMMIVYYDTPRQVSASQGSEMIQSSEFVYPLVVSVKEGSLIPKDRLTMRNEAIDLWGAQAIDPLTLAERLEEPNPEEFTKRLIMWKTNPMAYAQLYAQQTPPVMLPPEQTGQIQEKVGEQPAQNLLNSVPIQ